MALLLIVLSPSAQAHGDPGPYDPLTLEWHVFLADGGVAAQPAAGAVPLAEPARFAFAAPVRFQPVGGFEVELEVRAGATPLLGADAQGNALELRIEPEGAPRRVPLPSALLPPGGSTSVRARLDGPSRVLEEGTPMALVVSWLGTGDASIALGEGSRLDARDMRVPELRDLRMQEARVTEFLLAQEAFQAPQGSTLTVLRVEHAAVTVASGSAAGREGAYVLLRGEETDATVAHAHASYDERIARAHAFAVGGQLVRVHPGTGVAVRLPPEGGEVRCVNACPDGGFSHVVARAPTPGGTSAPPEPPASVLVPPPRDTSGVPVSADEPEARETPAASALMAVLVTLLLLARRT